MGPLHSLLRKLRLVDEARASSDDDEDPTTRGEDEALLGLLREQPDSTAEELAAAVGGSTTRLARQLQALEARGHVSEYNGRYRAVS